MHVLNMTLKGSFFMSIFLSSCGDINSRIAGCQSELTIKLNQAKNGGTRYVRIFKAIPHNSWRTPCLNIIPSVCPKKSRQGVSLTSIFCPT